MVLYSAFSHGYPLEIWYNYGNWLEIVYFPMNAMVIFQFVLLVTRGYQSQSHFDENVITHRAEWSWPLDPTSSIRGRIWWSEMSLAWPGPDLGNLAPEMVIYIYIYLSDLGDFGRTQSFQPRFFLARRPPRVCASACSTTAELRWVAWKDSCRIRTSHHGRSSGYLLDIHWDVLRTIWVHSQSNMMFGFVLKNVRKW